MPAVDGDPATEYRSGTLRRRTSSGSRPTSRPRSGRRHPRRAFVNRPRPPASRGSACWPRPTPAPPPRLRGAGLRAAAGAAARGARRAGPALGGRGDRPRGRYGAGGLRADPARRPPGRTTVVPGALRRDDPLVLRLDPPRRACVDLGLGPACVDPGSPRPGRRPPRPHRRGGGGGHWNVSGAVVAVPGRGSAALLAPVVDRAPRRGPGRCWRATPPSPGGSPSTGTPTRPGSPRVAPSRPRSGSPGRAATGGPHAVDRPAGGRRRRTADRPDPLRRGRAAGRPGLPKEVEPFVARRLRVTFVRPRGVRHDRAPDGRRRGRDRRPGRAGQRARPGRAAPAPSAGSGRRSGSTARSTTPRSSARSTTSGSAGRSPGGSATAR